MNYSIYPLLIPLLLNITPVAIASEQGRLKNQRVPLSCILKMMSTIQML